MTLESDSIGLSDVLATLREELEKAEGKLDTDGVKPRLFLDTAEVEIAFSVKRASDAKAGVKISVLGLGIEGGVSDTHQDDQTHKLKITLKPGAAKIGVASK